MGCDPSQRQTQAQIQLPFQYPRTDRMGCDARSLSRIGWSGLPFSILERIEWAATQAGGAHIVEPHGGVVFQYPRTDRMGCDAGNRSRTSGRRLRFQYPRTDRMGCDLVGVRQDGLLGGGFQYPRTDRMGCDVPCPTPRSRPAVLSVSSNGSNGLRLSKPRLAVTWTATFQYPRTDRMGCDSGTKIVPSGVSHFQYPRTDRMGCDPADQRVLCLELKLSVSSNGSNGLRRHKRGTADRGRGLSVSSNGSNGLRLREVNGDSRIYTDFQYPRTDRMGCDGDGGRRACPSPPLSVSSNGSNGLRLVSVDDDGNALVAFSILERIEWAATPTHRLRLRRRKLSVSSNGSNGLRRTRNSTHGAHSCPFQYPRTDRMGCDAVGDGESDEVGVTFSILERIEWAATRRPEPEKVTRIAFSILERIEWAATAPPLPQPG